MARAEELAKKFEAANNELVDTIQSMHDTQWRRLASSEDSRPLGVLAHHVAVSHEGIAGLAQAAASGQPHHVLGQGPPITMDQVHAINAEHAKAQAGVTREETIVLLKSQGAAAANAVRAMSDEQLDRSYKSPVLGDNTTTQTLVELVLIGHVQEHLNEIRQSIKS